MALFQRVGEKKSRVLDLLMQRRKSHWGDWRQSSIAGWVAKPGLTSNSEVCADAMAGTFIAKSGLQEGYIMSKRIVLALALWFCAGEGLTRAEGGSMARIG